MYNRQGRSLFVYIIILLLCLVVFMLFHMSVKSKLSDETKELVDDLRWKYHPLQAVQLEEWWEQQYPYLWFKDGVLYMTTEDTVWFIEMQRKEVKP